MTEERRPFVVVSERLAGLRRRLGPTAWVVLEELPTRSSGPLECCTATASCRALAVEFGLDKDTVARTLLVLRRAGVVTATQQRSSNGTFTCAI